jgi:hypothetical protein
MITAAPLQKAAAKPLQAATAKPLQAVGASLFLQRKCACGAGTSSVSGACEECSKKKMVGLQTKLRINEPGDVYEQEADRVAEQVLAKACASGRHQRASTHSALFGTAEWANGCSASQCRPRPRQPWPAAGAGAAAQHGAALRA